MVSLFRVRAASVCKVQVLLSVTKSLAPSAVVLLAMSVPAEIDVLPVKVLAPERVSVLAPLLVSATVPLPF